MTKRRLLVCLGVTVPAVLLVALFYRPLSSLENHVTARKYALRGEQHADTNIIIVYIDNEAVKSLGWPVRRNYYALMIRALTDLQVKAIGIDVLFEEPNLEYPEYDDLLAAVVAASRKVVLPSYFRAVLPPQSDSLVSTPFSPFLEFEHVEGEFQRGVDLHLPLSVIRDGAAGIGHVNLSGETDLPVFISAGKGKVPSFGMEVLRVSAGVARSELNCSSDLFAFGKTGKSFRVSPGGIAELNFPGKISAFIMYPFLEVLKSYDALVLREPRSTPTVPVAEFKDKIVLIGVIAEGRSEFKNTPLDSRFPSTGVHAVFLDNVLRSGFAHSSDRWSVIVLALLIGFGCAAVILFLPSPSGKFVAFGALAGVVLISFVLFFVSTYLLPLSPLLVVGLTSTMGSLFYKHRLLQAQVDTLRADKESILVLLRDKEAKLGLLQRELLTAATAQHGEKTATLLEEIARYKAEIRTLSSRADDMEEYHGEEKEQGSQSVEYEGIVYGVTGPMKPIVDFIGKIAGSDAPVLILGESGTGKELVARAIHRHSQRRQGPFIAVNCGALAETLLESELFGYEKGAFTGAVRDKAGRFELADGGTMFLDEIGEVSESFQVKLLRVLQEGEFERVGGTRTISVNVRVLAATNKNLKEAVESRLFRQDLYYRLNVLSIELPSLKERQKDIPLLVDHFLRREGSGMKVSKNVMEALQGAEWHGNIRELESVVTRAVLLARADGRAMVTMKDLTEEIAAALQRRVPIEDQVLGALREKSFSRSSISETAEELGGLNRGTVAEYLRGECLQAFTEHGFDLERAVRHISLSPSEDVNDRVRKKMREYLINISEAINRSQPWEMNKDLLNPKTKNLPQRYHSYLEKVAEAYFRGLWKLDS